MRLNGKGVHSQRGSRVKGVALIEVSGLGV